MSSNTNLPIPPELLLKIFGYFNIKSLNSHCRSVCRTWQKYVDAEVLLRLKNHRMQLTFYRGGTAFFKNKPKQSENLLIYKFLCTSGFEQRNTVVLHPEDKFHREDKSEPVLIKLYQTAISADTIVIHAKLPFTTCESPITFRCFTVHYSKTSALVNREKSVLVQIHSVSISLPHLLGNNA